MARKGTDEAEEPKEKRKKTSSADGCSKILLQKRAARLDSFRLHYNACRRRSSSQHQHSTEPELLTSSPGVWLSSPSPTTPPKWKTVTTSMRASFCRNADKYFHGLFFNALTSLIGYRDHSRNIPPLCLFLALRAHGTKKKVEINEQQLSEVIKVDTLKGQMQRAVDHMKEEYVKNLSLRSTTGSTLLVSMITESDVSLFSWAGLPEMRKSSVTKEHRENLAKNAKTLYVKCRDSIKDVQNKFIKDVKTKTNISQDDSHIIQDQIVCLADQYVSTAEKILEAKHTELIGKD
uniref:Ribosome-recycling factor, mitochondrial n=1 Tax=Timema poppense TaxID=170557 RepID=A0A7R9CHL6_TIMPO|nr:unnamed protein product [Timema poppensis]